VNYILDSQGNPILEPDYLKWAVWFERAERHDERHIGNDHFGDMWISTIFLASAHISKEIGNDNVMLYETMVFASDEVIERLLEISETDDRSIFSTFFGGIDIQKRYATRQEAEQGHKNMCIFVETCIVKGLIEVSA